MEECKKVKKLLMEIRYKMNQELKNCDCKEHWDLNPYHIVGAVDVVEISIEEIESMIEMLEKSN